MRDPLEGLDAQEREWLTNLAQTEGLTLEQARQRRDKVAAGITAEFQRLMEERGVTQEYLKQNLESEQNMIEFIRTTTGMEFSGRWGIALASNTGARSLEGASRAHAQTHGSKEDKSKRWGEYQNYLNELMQRNKSLSLTAARHKTAVNFGVSVKTIQRHTEKPK